MGRFVVSSTIWSSRRSIFTVTSILGSMNVSTLP
uniref:Uncharacterized protein n=1 Tax=Arundo donax TaxID=35708 RepID=A0A0A8ZYQ7_ARUDO